MSFNTNPSPSVAGPSTSTDKAVARFDGTAGSVLQSSAVTVTDAGDVQTPGSVVFASPDGTHTATLAAADTMSVSITIKLPATAGAIGDSLRRSADATTLEWFAPLNPSQFTAYKTEIPIKYAAYAASTANIDMGAGTPASIDGVDFSVGGIALLKNQTLPSENGLWRVDPFGVWERDPTMPDNTSSAFSAIVAVNAGGTVNGNTIWYSKSTGDGDVPFAQVATNATPMSVVSLTTTQRDALSGVANGQLIYNTTTNKFQGRAGGAWADLN